jgi:hypothetical protein
MKDIKFFIGPMTQNVIDSVIEFAEEHNVRFGFVISRRQIDYYCGYVGYNTKDFIKYVRSKTDKVLLCRDHSGLNQGTLFNDKGLYNPTYIDLTSMNRDALEGIDIIHIDPWKKFQVFDQGIRETINNILYVYQCNPNVLFEIATEEAIKCFKPENLYHLLNNLEIELGDEVFKNIVYAVIQSGTRLEGTKNTGKFSLDRLKEMTYICKGFDLLSKEHNGDYLSNEEIKMRFDNGLDAINIAPEFGVIETKVLLDHINNDRDLEKIYQLCLKGKKWEKWVSTDFDPDDNRVELIEICGHYHNKEIKDIVKIDDNIIKEKIKNRLQELHNIIDEKRF